MYTAGGRRIGDRDVLGLAPWPVWWDADPQKEVLYRNRLFKFGGDTLLALPGNARCAFVGDWREEMVVGLPGELRVYTTAVPAEVRRPWLMEDRLYRLYIAVNTMGYNTPPQHSAF